MNRNVKKQKSVIYNFEQLTTTCLIVLIYFDICIVYYIGSKLVNYNLFCYMFVLLYNVQCINNV